MEEPFTTRELPTGTFPVHHGTAGGKGVSGVDFKKICKDYGIRPRSFRQIEGATPNYKQNAWGLSFMRDGDPVIVFDDTRPTHEQRYTIAHELGHVLLGHLSLRNQELTTNPDFCEVEANIFAAVLMANDILCRYGATVATECKA